MGVKYIGEGLTGPNIYWGRSSFKPYPSCPPTLSSHFISCRLPLTLLFKSFCQSHVDGVFSLRKVKAHVFRNCEMCKNICSGTPPSTFRASSYLATGRVPSGRQAHFSQSQPNREPLQWSLPLCPLGQIQISAPDDFSQCS